MYKYIINFSYDGSKFNGYATQPNKNTIQDKIEETLTKLNSNEFVRIFGTSRTDAKVHAKDQYAQFYLNNKYEINNFKKKMNKLLPSTINIISLFEDFEDKINVRYDVESKTYKYLILLEKNPFLINYAYYINFDVDVSLLKEAVNILVGTHDFSAFCNNNTEIVDKVRTVNFIKIEENEFLNTKSLKITINANGYLYNMVRIIVGTLLEIGRENLTLSSLESILYSKKRSKYCVCAPPEGLYLEKTNFKKQK